MENPEVRNFLLKNGEDRRGGLCSRFARLVVGSVAALLNVCAYALIFSITVGMSGQVSRVCNLATYGVDNGSHSGIKGDAITAHKSALATTGWVLLAALLVGVVVQLAGFLAVLLMRRGLAVFYICVQVVFILVAALALGLGIAGAVSARPTDSKNGLATDGASNAITKGLVQSIQWVMAEQRKHRLGGVDVALFEQQNECCGLISSDDYWNADARSSVNDIGDVFLGSQLSRRQLEEIDPRWRAGGTWWHLDCMKANNDGQLPSPYQPMCYAPKSCCRHDYPDCNAANINLNDSGLSPYAIYAVDRRQEMATAFFWDYLKQRQLNNDVRPLHPDALFSQGCFAALRPKLFHGFIGFIGVSALALLFTFASLIAIFSIFRSMK